MHVDPMIDGSLENQYTSFHTEWEEALVRRKSIEIYNSVVTGITFFVSVVLLQFIGFAASYLTRCFAYIFTQSFEYQMGRFPMLLTPGIGDGILGPCFSLFFLILGLAFIKWRNTYRRSRLTFDGRRDAFCLKFYGWLFDRRFSSDDVRSMEESSNDMEMRERSQMINPGDTIYTPETLKIMTEEVAAEVDASENK